MLTNFGAASNSSASSNCGVVPYHNIMSNLHLIIQFNTCTDNRIIQCTPVDGRTRTYFDIIANSNTTKLRNFNPFRAIFGEPKTIGSKHCTAMDNAAFANTNAMIQRDISRYVSLITDNTVRANTCIRANGHPITNHNTWPNHNTSAQINVFANYS